MPAFLVRISGAPMGPGAPKVENVHAVADDEVSALALVKTALRLQDERVEIVRKLTANEAERLNLKPFQVKRLK
jgi:hypothetical protein